MNESVQARYAMNEWNSWANATRLSHYDYISGIKISWRIAVLIPRLLLTDINL